MSYQMPTLESLRKLADTLAAKYEGDNPDRLSFITLAKRLAEDKELMASPDADDILMGAYLAKLEDIAKDCWLDPRSNLHKIILNELQTAENQITDEHRIICMSAYFNYLKTRAPKNLTEKTKWMVNEPLEREVLGGIKKVLKRFDQQLQCLLTAQPSFEQLQLHLQDVETKYMQAPSNSWWGSDKSHLPSAKFMDLMSEYCDLLPHEKTPSLDPALQVLEAYLLRMAAAVFVMKTIETTHRTPTNSALYNMCVKATNFKHTKYIPTEDLVNWFGMLSSHLKSMLENRKAFISEKEKANYKNIRSELERIQKASGEFRDALVIQKDQPNFVESKVAFIVGGVASHALQGGLRKVAGDILPNPAAILMDTAAGAIGSPLGPGGVFAMYALSRFVRNVVFPLAVASACASAVDATGAKIGEVTVRAGATPFSLTANIISGAIGWYRHVEFDKNALRTNEKLHAALISLPDDALSPAIKDNIDNTFGTKARMAMK